MISTASSNDVAARQKYLGRKGLVVLLALLSAFVPLSTDLYLPSLPTMSAYFHVPQYEVNLTLILFFVFYALGTLVWGPLSDKYGRRPILLTGLAGYAVAGLLCSVSSTVLQLILFRVAQAIGGSAASVVATAVVKDVYQGRRRESILAIVQSMVVISPAVAPVIGALLLRFTSWRGVFVAQAILGVAAFLGSVAYRETLESRGNGSIARTMGRLVVVLRNPAFASLLITFSMMSIASLAFISSSSYIYQEVFGLSSQTYSYFFTFNAMGMLFGPLIYVRLSTRFRRYPIINVCFAIMVVSGVAILARGQVGPWVFAVALLPATAAGSCVRPPSTFLMLEQQRADSGSASSLMSSFAIVMGSIGILIISLAPGNLVLVIGALNVIIGLLCGGLWLVLARTPLLSKVRQP